MDNSYTIEKNAGMLIYLMKQHGIKKVIASPGTTNITLVASLQRDPYFEMYSVADERSAAYMACGLAAESGEPVALSCTGATASRNYIPGLTEAYYRKLPVLAITSTQHTGRIGQLCPQVIDRTQIQNDIAVKNVQIPMIRCDEDEWDCNVKLNMALLALRYRGGGPVHINLGTEYSREFTVKKLQQFRVIRRIGIKDEFPQIKADKTAIFVGTHQKWTKELTDAVDTFCEVYNGTVFCDHTSNYQGKYGIQFNLICGQNTHRTTLGSVDLLIDMGEMSGAYMKLQPKEVWRVNPDGEIRDTFRKLTCLFDMDETDFFRAYEGEFRTTSYYDECRTAYNQIISKLPQLPFSNNWIASQTAPKLPEGSVLHLAILNTLRSWNFFETPPSISCYANTGGFGIDGIVSTLIGAALADKNKLHFLVVGDLAFFYDLNAIANKNVGNNIRIILVNNGCGTEFKNYNHFAAQFGKDADDYIAAAGHYGKQSRKLVKDYAENLGFEYFSAENKKEYINVLERFMVAEITDRPMLLEVFTTPEDESRSLEMMNHILTDSPMLSARTKQIGKKVLGNSGVRILKRWIMDNRK